MRRTALRVAAAAVLLGVVVAGPAGRIRPTAASWTDAAFDRARITVADAGCTATGAFAAQASSALLAGSVQGVPVGSPGQLAAVTTGRRTDGVALSGDVVADASGTAAAAAGVLLTPHGTWSQVAGTTGTGTSSAGAGGGTALGAVDVLGLLTRAPTAGGLLPGLSGVGLDVGAVASTASQNGCAAAWGDAGTLVRSSSVSSLGLRFTDASVVHAVGALRTKSTAVAAALTTQASTASSPLAKAASDGLLAAVTQSLTSGSASASPATASVTVSTLPITTTEATRTTGSTTLDLVSGEVRSALAIPAGPEGDALTSPVAATIGRDTGGSLRQRATALTDAAATAREGAIVAVHAAVDVSVGGLKVAVVALDASLPASAWTAAPAPALQVQVQVLGALQAGLQNSVTDALGSTLVPKVQQALLDSFLTPARVAATADLTTVARTTDTASAAVQTSLAALPAVLSVTTDQRATTAADSWTGSAETGGGAVTAVRVRVRDLGGTRADLFLGSSAVGPNRAAFR